MVEQYCWAIGQAAGRPCRGQSGSSVLAFGFKLTLFVCRYIIDGTRTQFRLASELLPQGNCVMSGSVCTEEMEAGVIGFEVH